MASTSRSIQFWCLRAGSAPERCFSILRCFWQKRIKEEPLMTELAKHFGLATLAIGIALVSAPALASLIAPTRVQCAGDEYVVGLTGRTGYWIDAVGPICARWDERTFQSVRRPQSRRPVGGGGGGMNQQSCPT